MTLIILGEAEEEFVQSVSLTSFAMKGFGWRQLLTAIGGQNFGSGDFHGFKFGVASLRSKNSAVAR
jgi:hypothetical protein